MSLRLLQGPAIEPLTLDEVKAHLNIHEAVTDDDALLQQYRIAAREELEIITATALIEQVWQVGFGIRPRLRLPRRPVLTVDAVEVERPEGPVALPPEAFRVGTEELWTVLSAVQSWGACHDIAEPIRVTFTAGFGGTMDAVPARWKQAILVLVATWYESRESPSGGPILMDTHETLTRVLGVEIPPVAGV